MWTRALHERDRCFREADPETAPRFAIEEGVERHHVFNLDTVNAKPRRDSLDSAVTDVAKAMLDLLNDIKEAASVGSEFLDDGCDR